MDTTAADLNRLLGPLRRAALRTTLPRVRRAG